MTYADEMQAAMATVRHARRQLDEAERSLARVANGAPGVEKAAMTLWAAHVRLAEDTGEEFALELADPVKRAERWTELNTDDDREAWRSAAREVVEALALDEDPLDYPEYKP